MDETGSCEHVGCMSLMLRRGEKVTVAGRTMTVTDLAINPLSPVRDHLIEVAKAGRTPT